MTEKCIHLWTTVFSGSPGEPADAIGVCKKCGAEQMEESPIPTLRDRLETVAAYAEDHVNQNCEASRSALRLALNALAETRVTEKVTDK